MSGLKKQGRLFKKLSLHQLDKLLKYINNSYKTKKTVVKIYDASLRRFSDLSQIITAVATRT